MLFFKGLRAGEVKNFYSHTNNPCIRLVVFDIITAIQPT